MADCVKEIHLSSQPFTLSFHPTRPLLAVGLITGDVEIHTLPTSSSQAETTIDGKTLHKMISPFPKSVSCRSLSFHPVLTSLLYAASSNGEIAVHDLSNNTTSKFVATDKGAGLSSLTFSAYDSNVMWTGDDTGVIRTFDVRTPTTGSITSSQSTPIYVGEGIHGDFVSGFVQGNGSHPETIIGLGGDGRISVFDQRNLKNPFVKKSEEQDDEMLSGLSMKNGSKYVIGTQGGVLNFWTYGTWGNISDRFPGHPDSIDAMVKIDESTLVTGSSDGLLRVCSVQPDKFIGVLGDHEGFPVEEIELNKEKTLMGSLSHDNKVRLWDARVLFDDDEGEGGGEGDIDAVDMMREKGVGLKGDDEEEEDEEEWEDMDEEDGGGGDDMDEDEDDDDEEGGGKYGIKTEAEKFFQDL